MANRSKQVDISTNIRCLSTHRLPSFTLRLAKRVILMEWRNQLLFKLGDDRSGSSRRRDEEHLADTVERLSYCINTLDLLGRISSVSKGYAYDLKMMLGRSLYR